MNSTTGSLRGQAGRAGILMTLVAALALSACGRGAEASSSAEYPDPGISDDSITIGSSVPLSGPASAYATVAESHKAYFKYVNDELGGIDGRKINYVVYDDGYDPAQTVENARRLLEHDHAFAIFGVIGTPTNLAIREYINKQKVPQLFIGSADTSFGSNDSTSWSMGLLPAFTTEASIMSKKMLAQNPSPKVAILYQNDDFGEGILKAFEAAFQGTQITLVGKQSYDVTDPTVDSQIVNLKASGADVLISWANPKQTAQSIKKVNEIGWKPDIYISSATTSVSSVMQPAGLEAATGVRSTFYTKDPSDPQWTDDEGMKEYERIVTTYGSKIDPADQIAVLGYLQAALLTESIKRMEEPSRQGLLDAAMSLSNVEVGVLLPGITASTGQNDRFPIETEQIQRFDGTQWVPDGEPVSLEGKTPPVG